MNTDFNNSYSEHLKTSNVIKDALVKPNIDTTIDYLEIGLDSFITEGFLKDIPIVQTIVGLTKGTLKIREIHFAKKILSFLKEFHSGKLSEHKMNEFKSRLIDKSYREKVLEHIMIYIDRFIEVEKSKIYANLFLAYLNSKFDWEDFKSLSNCLEKLNLISIDFLHSMANEEKPFYKGYSQFDDNVALLISAGLIQQWGTHIIVTNHGKYLYFYGILGEIDYLFEQNQN